MTAAGHPVRIGDVVTLALDRSVRVVRVEGICERRGNAPAARALYRDLG
jgi:ribosome-associated heat shock protein Hsp15